MLFLRTAAGGFVDAATIVRLCEEPDGWVAICDDDRQVALAAYYNAPGRLKELQHSCRLNGPAAGLRKRSPAGAVIAPSDERLPARSDCGRAQGPLKERGYGEGRRVSVELSISRPSPRQVRSRLCRQRRPWRARSIAAVCSGVREIRAEGRQDAARISGTTTAACPLGGVSAARSLGGLAAARSLKRVSRGGDASPFVRAAPRVAAVRAAPRDACAAAPYLRSASASMSELQSAALLEEAAPEQPPGAGQAAGFGMP